MARKHVAVYGSTRILRGFCPRCKWWALIVKDEYQCCDSKINEESELSGQKRMIECQQVRKSPSREAINKMLEIQDNKCLYCEIPFGTHYKHPRLNKMMTTRICYDHFIPYSYSQDNRDVNFVCACGTCNGIKSDKVFESVEQARDFVKHRRLKKGYTKEIYVL